MRVETVRWRSEGLRLFIALAFLVTGGPGVWGMVGWSTFTHSWYNIMKCNDTVIKQFVDLQSGNDFSCSRVVLITCNRKRPAVERLMPSRVCASVSLFSRCSFLRLSPIALCHLDICLSRTVAMLDSPASSVARSRLCSSLYLFLSALPHLHAVRSFRLG